MKTDIFQYCGHCEFSKFAGTLGKENTKAVYGHPAYSSYMQSTSYKMPVWIAGRNINYVRYVDDTTLMAESEEEWKSLLIKVKEECEKVGLKLNIQKTNTIASGLITAWKIDEKTMETVTGFIF